MLSRPRSSTTAKMHFALGHHVYDPTDKLHPAVASAGRPAVRPPGRPTNINRNRSASNPARSIERYESHLPSGEYRGVLSAPGDVVIARRRPLSTTNRSTFVL